MKSTRSTDESTQSGKQITESKRSTLGRVAMAVATVVLSGSGLIVINNRFTFFNLYIFGWGQDPTEWHVNDHPDLLYKDNPSNLDEDNPGEDNWWPGESGMGHGDNNYVYTFAIGGQDHYENTAIWRMGRRVGEQEIEVYIPCKHATATVDYQIRIRGTDNPITYSIEQAKEGGWTFLGTINSDSSEVSIMVADNGAIQDYRRKDYPDRSEYHNSSIGIDAIRMRCVSNCTP